MDFISHLEKDQIFVFGSNEAGIHGAGAALTAALKFGAKRGQAFGRQGQSFAIPTREYTQRGLRTLRLEAIQPYVAKFLDYARCHADLEFLLTPIGCGHAGYSPQEIKLLFADAPPNVKLPPEFK